MYLYLYFFVKKMGGKKLLINISLKPQGTNGRLYFDFGLHPNFWKFLRCCAAVFLRAETDIRELELYNNLKMKREQLKANLRAGLVTLEQYLASVGAISLATGRKKVEDDGDEGIEPSFEPHGAGEVSIYIADATPDQTITELPWPAPQPFEVITEVEPGNHTGQDNR